MLNQSRKYHQFFLLAVFLFFFGVILQSCGSAHKNRIKVAREGVREAYEMQKPMQVRTSLDDKRPKWTRFTATEDEDLGVVYFSGGYMNGSDYSVTVRCANAEALKACVQGVSQFVRGEFSQVTEGSNIGSLGVDRYVTDSIATVTDNMHMQGIRQSEIYYEEVFSPSAMQSTYNIWVRLEIPKIDYLKLKADVIRQLRDKFNRDGREDAKNRAERILDDLKKAIRWIIISYLLD